MTHQDETPMTQSGEGVERLTCPFCGCNGKLSYYRYAITVQCEGCLAEGPAKPTDDVAVEAWNRRAAMRSPSAALPEGWREKVLPIVLRGFRERLSGNDVIDAIDKALAAPTPPTVATSTPASELRLPAGVEQFPADTVVDDLPPRQVLAAVRYCASLWEGGARLVGNVRACDIVRSIDAALSTPTSSLPTWVDGLVEALDGMLKDFAGSVAWTLEKRVALDQAQRALTAYRAAQTASPRSGEETAAARDVLAQIERFDRVDELNPKEHDDA